MLAHPWLMFLAGVGTGLALFPVGAFAAFVFGDKSKSGPFL